MTGSEQMTIDVRAAAICEQNDAFRKNLSGGRLNVTSGVVEHTEGQIGALMLAIAAFDQFTNDNDPHIEHDFGSLTYMDQPLFWKIDYYDLDMRHGSPNPADTDVTIRVLTVMMAWEY